MQRRCLPRLILTLTLALALAACGGEGSPPADTAATVNGEAVPMTHYSALVAASQHKVGQVGIPVSWVSADGARRLSALQAQALKQVVRNAVIGQLANARQITVSDVDLVKALGDLETAYGGPEGLAQQLAQDGLSREDFGALYRFTLLDRQLRQADPVGYQSALDQALAGARVRAYVGPCATDHQYPRCLGTT